MPPPAALQPLLRQLGQPLPQPVDRADRPGVVVEARLAVALREAAPVAPQLAQVQVPGAAGGAAGLELGAGIIMGNWR